MIGVELAHRKLRALQALERGLQRSRRCVIAAWRDSDDNHIPRLRTRCH
jgi:hypothetical protein